MGGVNSINLLPAVIFKEYLKTYDIDYEKKYYFTNTDVIIKAFTANLANYVEDTIKKGEKLDKLKIIYNIEASLKPYDDPETKNLDSSLMDHLIQKYYVLNKANKQNDDENKYSFGIINDIKEKEKIRSYDTIGQSTTKNDIDKYLMLQGISTVYYLEKTLKKIVDDLMKKDISGGNYKKSKKNNKSKKSKKGKTTRGNYKKSKRSKKSKKSKKDNRNKKK
jgi:hypothetical protein